MNVLVIHNYVNDLRVYVLDRTLKCLREAGHRAFVITPEDRRYGRLRYSRNYHKWSTYDVERLDAATINAYCHRRSIDVVVPADIGSGLLLSRIQHQISPARTFPLADPETLALLHNKWRFMRWLGEKGLPAPESQLVTAGTAIEELDVSYPLIAKPLEECGSAGVQKIDSLDALREYTRDHRAHTADPFLIQPFIAGDDLVFGLVADHGKVRAWTIQRFRKGDGAKKLDHLEYIEHPELLRCGEQIVRALSYHGVAEFDVRLDAEGRPWFIECNPRLWASIAISHHMGVNYVDLGIRLAMGQPLPNARQTTGSYVWPERALARLVRRQVRLSDLSASTRSGLVAELSDPVPFAYLVYEWMSSR